MTLTQKLLGVASFGLASVTASFGQQATASETTASLLGVRYVEAGLGVLDVRHDDRGAYSVGANVNVPVTANLDLAAGYSHNWAENNDSFYDNVVFVEATAYLTEGAFRPFAVAGLGYIWEGSGDDNYGAWRAGLGVEYSINATTAVTLEGSYSDTFEDRDAHAFSGTLSLSHWFTSSVAGTIGATWFEYGDVGYGVSAIFKF
jgi:hypothetical protein